MIHIAPWEATIGLMRAAASLLPTGGLLYTYGPYRRNGQHTAPSNAAFDADLRARNSAGHSKIESTERYLGIEVDDAIEIAEKIDI